MKEVYGNPGTGGFENTRGRSFTDKTGKSGDVDKHD